MKLKNIEVGKWYYIRKWPLGAPFDAYPMQVIQKTKRREVVLRDEILESYRIVTAKQVLAEVLPVQDSCKKHRDAIVKTLNGVYGKDSFV